ncbi:MAG: ABC transporter permease [Bacillota bacterium]
MQAIRYFLTQMSRNRIGFAGFLIFCLIVLYTLVGPLLVPLDPTAHLDEIYQTPSARHWFGTDNQGRDIFAQITHGGRELIQTAALAATTSTVIAVTFGSLGALLGGWADTLIVGAADMVLTIPQFPLLAVLATFIRLQSGVALGALLGLLSWAGLLRSVRAVVLSLRERDYVQAARGLGLPTSHILFKEIMPNMVGYIAINFTFAMTHAMYSQVGLIMLGMVPLSSQNWGVMISQAWGRGAIFNRSSVWYIIAPVSAIALLQLSLVTMTRSLEEVFNPRLRGGE